MFKSGPLIRDTIQRLSFLLMSVISASDSLAYLKFKDSDNTFTIIVCYCIVKSQDGL